MTVYESFVVGYSSSCGLRLLDISLKLVVDHQSPHQIQGEKMKIYPLQDKSILENELYGMTDISSWMLKPIAKKLILPS